VIQLVVMLYVRYPLSLRNVEDLAFERGPFSAYSSDCRQDLRRKGVRLGTIGSHPPASIGLGYG